jgi:NitT/TauT family transport system permease protein
VKTSGGISPEAFTTAEPGPQQELGSGIVAAGRVVGLEAGVRASRTGRGLGTADRRPSCARFPLAILLFRLSEQAILFVILLGAAPAIANGLIDGIDHIPPLLLRAERVLGATGLARYRHVVLPAALPGFVGGMKQGWAFAWRSLMAGAARDHCAAPLARRPAAVCA